MGSLLESVSDELVVLAANVVASTAIVTGQTSDFGQSSGSAWLYAPSLLVTNDHVVNKLAVVFVRFPGLRRARAEVVGRDPLTDLAVLRVDGDPGRPLPVRNTPARLGELCFAFGSPLGEYPESVTGGVVSGIRRRLRRGEGQRDIEDVLQTDAAINPGNSGGPLVAASGQVIGVNTAGDTRAANICFAVPAATVVAVADELIEHGSVDRASLGVTVVTRTVERDGACEQRLAVSGVRAMKAGPLAIDDVILRVAGHEVGSRGDLYAALRRDLIGRPTEIEVWRDRRVEVIECEPRRLDPTP